MKLIKSIIGVFAVIFSIQNLASWAVRNEKSEGKFNLSIPERGSDKSKDGSPSCH